MFIEHSSQIREFMIIYQIASLSLFFIVNLSTYLHIFLKKPCLFYSFCLNHIHFRLSLDLKIISSWHLPNSMGLSLLYQWLISFYVYFKFCLFTFLRYFLLLFLILFLFILIDFFFQFLFSIDFLYQFIKVNFDFFIDYFFLNHL